MHGKERETKQTVRDTERSKSCCAQNDRKSK